MPATIRTVVWPFDAALTGRLTYYPPGLRQGRHEHDRAHLSFVLAGDFAEQEGRQDAERFSGDSVNRPAGGTHAVQFGRRGALILAVEEGAPLATDSPMTASPVDALRPRAWQAAAGEPPVWLETARQLLAERPLGIAAVARACGVHRVHLTRTFRRAYGLTPAAFRTRSMLARAVSQTLIQRRSLAEAAMDAGFADQAHLSRAMRAMCGISAARLRAVLSRAG